MSKAAIGHRAMKGRSLALFIGLIFLIPIIAAVWITVLEGRPELIAIRKLSRPALVAIAVMVLSPAIAAVLAALRDDGLAGLKALLQPLFRWRVAVRWHMLALFLFPAIILVTLFLLGSFSRELVPAFVFSLLPLAGLFSTMAEELGWTGYATPALLERSTPLKAALVLGALQALWHLPADLWGSGAFHGSDFMVHFLFTSLAIVAFRVIAVWMYVHTQSLLLCWFAHVGFKCGQLVLVPHNISSQGTIIWQVAFMLIVGFLALVVLARGSWASGARR